MKCIASDKDKDLVVRVTDDEARRRIVSGWHYVPKQVWKAKGRQR